MSKDFENNFCVFILTHGRPENQITHKLLRNCGYTGKIFLVVDDKDETADQYKKLFAGEVVIFSKDEAGKEFDQGDNFDNQRAPTFARNFCFKFAEEMGFKYFMQFDDDYFRFAYRFNDKKECGWWPCLDIDSMFSELLEYYKSTPALSICVSQGGDWIGGTKGGAAEKIWIKRKAMNTFLCSTDRPFKFCGKMNDDVNTYTSLGRQGELFMMLHNVQCNQIQTQANEGGMTEAYVDSGTYFKSFCSVMYAPSCVKIGMIGPVNPRMHHAINWKATAAQIIREEHRKP